MSKTVHVFSNVIRPNMMSLSSYNATNCGPNDLFVFLNDARPLTQLKGAWRPPNFACVHRECGHVKGNAWFGTYETKDLSPVDRFFLSDNGVIEDTHQRRGKLAVPLGYPSGKSPTTGFWVAINALSVLFPTMDDLVLVGFYGSLDKSTLHFEGHAWHFEETFLASHGFRRCFLD